MKFAIPPRLAVDADGYVWRIFDDEFSGELWSVATVNLDNSPTPEPVTFYVPADQVIAARRDAYADALGSVSQYLSIHGPADLADWLIRRERAYRVSVDGPCPACAGAMPADQMGRPLQVAHETHAAPAAFAVDPAAAVDVWGELGPPERCAFPPDDDPGPFR